MIFEQYRKNRAVDKSRCRFKKLHFLKGTQEACDHIVWMLMQSSDPQIWLQKKELSSVRTYLTLLGFQKDLW